MKKYSLEIIVFITGMAVMVFELVGARVLAPFMGTSVIVWSGLIGVIMLSLALGYWWGGKMADRNPDHSTLSTLILLSAIFIGLTSWLKLPILSFVQSLVKYVRVETVLASLLLFGPGSFFLAAVSPYAVRLKIVNLKQSGQTVGNLYAISTAGSIFGTFLTGFVLVLYLGNTRILLSLATLLLLCSLAAYQKKWFKTKVAVLVLLIASQFVAAHIDYFFWPKNVIAVVYSQYANIFIAKDFAHYSNGSQRPILTLSTNFDFIQSAKFLDGDGELTSPYMKNFRMAEYFNPGIKKTLLLGGGAYIFPHDFLARNSQATMDVAEIDPKMTEAAKKYFGLEDNPRLAAYNEDGRLFLERNQNKYDAVYVDVFRSNFVPYQLTTEEAVGEIYRSLDGNGVVLMNIISSIQGGTGKFLRAEYATYKKVFPQVYVFRVASPNPGDVQNLVMVALKSNSIPSFSSQDPELSVYLSHLWDQKIDDDMPILTDDFAPTEQYLLPLYEYNRANS